MKQEYSDSNRELSRNSNPATTELSQLEQEKITNLCNVYGLNQQETRQLIEQLKIGGNISIDNEPIKRRQPSIVQTKNEELSFNDSEFKFQEQYSFKQLKKIEAENHNQHEQSFQKLLMGKLKFQEEYYQKIKEQNEILKAQKEDLNKKMNLLFKMKEQQTDIILGLKNTIVSLTTLLKDKQTAYNELQQNYNRLVISFQDSSKSRISQLKPQRDMSKTRPEKRQSRENILTQISLKDSNIERRQSKQLSKIKSTSNIQNNAKLQTKLTAKQISNQNTENPKMTGRPNMIQQKVENNNNNKYAQNKYGQNKYAQTKYSNNAFNKKQKIDISKYKVFIDELRNICLNKQKS